LLTHESPLTGLNAIAAYVHLGRGRFYDSAFYPEGCYGTRWHGCDRINHATRTEELRLRRTTLLEAILGRN
jgi:hypothetical protein